MDNSQEIFPVVDENGNVIGSATRQECHSGSKILHPVVHLHVFDPQGRLYLQRRPEWKDIQPGKWDTAVGGHVDDFEEAPVAKYVFESDMEKELVNTFRTVTTQEIKPTDELDGGRFWRLDEIRDNIGKGVFTPNFEHEFISILDKHL